MNGAGDEAWGKKGAKVPKLRMDPCAGVAPVDINGVADVWKV